MAGTPIGRILLMPKGNYSGTAVYNSLDWVRHNGSAWVCTTDNTTGIAPAAGVPEWQLLAQDGNVSGTVDWPNVNFKPFDTVGSGLIVDVAGTLKLDVSMLTGSNISYDNSGSGAASSDVQGAIDELFRGGGGGGMLPYLYIDSEAGATVTVVQPDSTTITPTAAGSGHWECELTGGYGTYVIHSVLPGQGDATQSLVVDTVMEYHVTDTHYDHTVSFVAPSGSTVRIEGGTEIYTLTGTGSTQTQAVHSASTSFTVTTTMDGNGKPYTFTTPSTTGQTTTIPSGTFDFGTINVSIAADFVTAGSTITCVNGGTSCTPKTAASTLVFRVPTTGTWTISGSVSGQTYSATATVTALGTPVSTSLQTVPDGSTVLPTDDIQTWLNCAGIYNKTSYTTLADVLDDATTLLALMSDNNAVDYLVRSKSFIGGGDDLVPVMTGFTTPSGHVYESSEYAQSSNQCQAWRAFNPTDSKAWYPASHSSGGVAEWIAYEFSTPERVGIVKLKNASNATASQTNNGKITVQGSNDSTNGSDGTWDDISTIVSDSWNVLDFNDWCEFAFVNTQKYKTYRVYFEDAKPWFNGGLKAQFAHSEGITDDSTAMTDIGANNYCADTLLDDADWCDAICNSTYFESVLNAKVPTMTGYTTPSGEVANMGDVTYPAWKAFDGTTSMAYVPVSNRYNPFYYKFTSNIRCVVAVVGGYPLESNVRLSKFKIQASTDGSTWVDLSPEITNTATSTGNKQKIILNNANEYLYYAMTATQASNGGYEIETIQFYGREDV